MPPQKPQNKASDSLKQKNLLGWFAPKGPQAASNGAKTTDASSKTAVGKGDIKSTQKMTQASHSRNASAASLKDAKAKSTASSSPATAKTSSSPASRERGSHVHDTPPTSDAIDVDMLSDDDDGVFKKPSNNIRLKKRRIMVDSDEESIQSSRKMVESSPLTSRSRSESMQKSSPPRDMKRPRMSNIISDAEDDDSVPAKKATQSLSRFRRPDNRSSSVAGSSSALSELETDHDEFPPPASSRRNSSISASARSGRSSVVSFVDSDYDSDASEHASSQKKKASKKSAKDSRPSMSQRKSTGNSNSFLTAAEQRAQDKKTEKKANEDAYEFLQDPRDKDGKRPGEPDYDPRTLRVPKSAWATFTPFEKQFWEIKQNHYDTILFFQKGKFYELYEDDARIGHQEFDLKLTERVKMCMVGVPEMSFNFWAAKFLAKGYKVGKVEQAETALGAEMRLASSKGTKKIATDAKADKIVRRELNKVYTNGTLVDADLLTDEEAGHCVAICESDNNGEGDGYSFGICVLDTSTSEFRLAAFEDNACRTKLETVMRQLRPKEILFTKGSLSMSTNRLLKVVLPSSCLWTSLRDVEGFTYDETIEELKKLYADEKDAMKDDDGFPEVIRSLMRGKLGIQALGAMIWYLRQLNIDKDILSMKNFNVLDPMSQGQGLLLDGQTLAHIEILMNSDGGEEGTLLKILNRCVTPFGKRLFRQWLCVPLRKVSDINARLDTVQDLIDNATFEQGFMNIAKGLPDLERMVSRIHSKNCKVKDFLKVLSSFAKLNDELLDLQETAEMLDSESISRLLKSAPDLKPVLADVQKMFTTSDEGPDELVPQEGQDELYTEIMTEIEETEAELESDLKVLEKKVGCSLSYWHSAVGNKEIYQVQTKSGQSGIPKDWIKSGSTKAVARWAVPQLAQSIRQLKEARERRNGAIKEFKFRVYAAFDKTRGIWLRAVNIMAQLDCLFSLAKSSTAIGQPACRPEFVESDTAFIDFEELRHPALSASSGVDFIPNDVKLGGEVPRITLLTGPNMGGKSTLMRMSSIGVIMAQLGMLVPAKSARLAPVDTILTRMGAYDNMFSRASTFKVELDECCKILRDATPRSLVVLDELGRGTSTYDGMAIAGAVLHELATHTLALSFFATHYGSLTDDFMYHPNIRNMHMATHVDDENRELVFLYKLIEGVAVSSFGTHVANLAGVPADVVGRAEIISSDFAKHFTERLGGKHQALPLVAQADFAYIMATLLAEQSPTDKKRTLQVLKLLKKTITAYCL